MQKSVTRRHFSQSLLAGVGLLSITSLTRCSKDDPASPSTDDDNNLFALSLAEAPELTTIGGAKSLVIDGVPITIFRLTEDGFVTFSRVCTHQSCTTEWEAEEERFECPCHESTFDKNGNVITGPATRRLTVFDTIFKASENKVVIQL